MCNSDNATPQDYGQYVTSALRTEGGHLSIGRGSFTLHFGRGARVSGYDCESFKACCIAVGLPVIDSRMVAFEDVVRLAVRGPMVAVGEQSSPPPYHALSFARSVSWRKPTGRPAPRSSTSRPSRARGRESEREAGPFATGWRSRERLPAARRGESIWLPFRKSP